MLEVANRLAEAGIEIFVDDGKLKTRSVAGAITPQLADLIRENKEELIQYLTALGEQRGQQVLPPIHPLAGKDERIPLSFSQRRLWFIDQMNGGSPEYNIVHVSTVGGSMTATIIEEILVQLLNRHTSLRTLIKQDSQGPYQEVVESSVPIQYLRSESKAETDSLINTFITRPFDLRYEIPFVACLVEQRSSVGDKRVEPNRKLAICVHHIAADGWSVQLLMSEFQTLYRNLIEGQKPMLQPLKITYAEFALWEQSLAETEAFKRSLAYWLERLSDAPLLHGLPIDWTRPKRKQNRGALLHKPLSANISRKLKHISLEQGVTPFMFLHAVLALVIARFSGEADVIVGVPVANRQVPDTRNLVGCFINSLVLRLDTDQVDFITYLDEVKKTHIAAQQHQLIPFELLVDELSVPRSMSHNPLFQIMLTMDNTSDTTGPIGASRESNQAMRKSSTLVKFDLTLDVALSDDGGSLTWRYDTALFKNSSITAVNDFFLLLLEHLSDWSKGVPESIYPDSLGTLSIEYQNTEGGASLGSPKKVETFFEANARRIPEQVAVVCGTNMMSYSDVDSRANLLSRAISLATKGKRSRIVAIFLKPSCYTLVSILAVFKSGFSYLPIDSKTPGARTEWLLKDAQIDVVISEGDLLESLAPTVSIDVINIEAVFGTASHEWEDEPVPARSIVDGDPPAYINYTSGTTGHPKGVVVSHSNLINYANGMREQFKFSEGLSYALVTSIGTDLGNTCLYLSMMFGGTLHLFSESEVIDAAFMSDYLQRYHLDIAKLTPSHFVSLYRAEETKGTGFSETLILGGEQSDAKAFRCLKDFLSRGGRLIHHYGPTETTIGCCAQEIKSEEDLELMPLGNFLPNQSGLILSTDGRAAPVGAVGELWVTGLGVAKGYWNDEPLTSSRFIELPLSGGRQQRFYRTGDIVRRLPNGQMIFIRRNDSQIKIRGYRVELREVEFWLNQCTEVEQAIARVVEDHNGERRLLAWVALKAYQHDSDQANTILSEMETLSPPHMVPDSIVCMDGFPLKPNGKIDQNKLPIRSRSAARRIDDAPLSETEQVMLESWAALIGLNVEQIDRTSNFFDLGGHSLIAIRLVSHLRGVSGIELDVKHVFEHPVLSEMARACEGRSARFSRGAIQQIVRSEGEFHPTSFSQQRLWYIDALQGGSPEYCMPKAFEVKGDLDFDLAEKAILKIIERHEVLRTSVISHDDVVKQKVERDFSFKLIRHDFRGFSTSEKEESVESLIKREQTYCFDLSAPLKIRASVAALGSKHCIFLFNVHHIASDGWSNNILYKEFITLYSDLIEDRKNSLSPLSLQFIDYAYWQRNWLNGKVLKEQLSYWTTHLADMPVEHSLPMSNPRPEQQNCRGIQLKRRLGEDASSRLRRLAADFQITPFMLFHGVLALVISRHSCSDDIVVGTPIANRMHKEVESLIGFFVNTLVLRISTDFRSLKRYFSHVRKCHLGAQSHQDVPFEQVVESCAAARSLKHSPLFQIMFSYGGLESLGNESKNPLPNVSFNVINGVSRLEDDGLLHTVAKFDLDIGVHSSMNRFIINWIYDTSLFELDEMERMLDDYVRLLENLAFAPNTPIMALSDCQMLSAQEVHRLVKERNQTLKSLNNVLVHQQFEYFASQCPDQIALIYETQEITYSNLNAEANRLANYLRAEGVGPGDRVGILIERSISMITATLAVLKTGAAYVPLEAKYPQDRLLYIIADSKVKLVLSTKSSNSNLCPDSAGKAVIYLDDLDLRKYSIKNVSLSVQIPEECPAYVIYTSGSTGHPKGTVVPHPGIVNLTVALKENYSLTKQDRILQFASHSFDMSVEEIFGALCSGSSLLLRTEEWLCAGEAFWNLCQKNRITVLNLPTAFFNELMLHDDFRPAQCIRIISVGGEKLTKKSIRRYYEAPQPRPKLFNAYGPTEYSVNISMREVDPKFPHSIGVPLFNTQVYVVSPDGSLAPDGAIGELCVSGKGMALGYLGRADLTSEKFVPNPFSDDSSKKMYKTGDLVRYVADSSIEFIGRADNQIKLRGYRIELGEIENAIINTDQVSLCCVVLKGHLSESDRIVAYVVKKDQESSTDEEIIVNLKNEMRERLPLHMIPSEFMVLHELPLTTNGKIDHKALPDPSAQAAKRDQFPPETEMEKLIAEIWADLLNINIESISLDDNFFVLGGHSLLLIRLLSLVEKKTGYFLELRQVYKYNTVRSLSALIDIESCNDSRLGEEMERLEF